MQLGVLEVSKCHWPAGSTVWLVPRAAIFLSQGSLNQYNCSAYPLGAALPWPESFLFFLFIFLVDILAIIAYI
tara:strand:- start:2530 stop:2748 length:219 start_codon:yes stop_codon:yes gene_type:complete